MFILEPINYNLRTKFTNTNITNILFYIIFSVGSSSGVCCPLKTMDPFFFTTKSFDHTFWNINQVRSYLFIDKSICWSVNAADANRYRISLTIWRFIRHAYWCVTTYNQIVYALRASTDDRIESSVLDEILFVACDDAIPIYYCEAQTKKWKKLKSKKEHIVHFCILCALEKWL